ncbi:MBL fold metallo-hydrolase [Paenibacillus durus]|uniref:Polyketide biosynthesis protein n=1 Tax=Paenibacillus durus TaxID=44251 RepID=A0A089HMY7_PAEDU|nr:MBL fold metallo-hydrolase [Paenibacillus durus]AIQ12427.1 polyketide biosynthesis protein [Paenibacillus durus]
MLQREYEVVPIKSSYESFINYSYLIIDQITRQAAVVDPAWDLEQICSLLKEKEANLVQLWLTHSHRDHVHLVKPLLDRFQPNVYMGAAEIEFYKYHCANLYPVYDQNAILLGNTLISCVWTPGHTTGSICYSLRGSLFTGDTIFTEGCGICTERGGDPRAMFHSMQKIRSRIHPDVLVYPAHSFGVSPGQPLRSLLENNIYFNIPDEEQFIAFRMRRNQPDSKSFV